MPPHAHDVSGLQHFLLDVVRRYVVAEELRYDETDELLASAAALDYALLVCRESEEDRPTPSAAVLEGIRESIERAVDRALDIISTAFDLADDAFRDFAERHAGPHGIFPVFARLRKDGALRSDELAFRAITLANDIAIRRTLAS